MKKIKVLPDMKTIGPAIVTLLIGLAIYETVVSPRIAAANAKRLGVSS